MTKGTDNFPKTTIKTMHILTDYVPSLRLQHTHNPDCKGLAFVQGEGGVLRGPKKDSANKEVKRWHFGGPHYKNKCPKLKLLDAGVQNINVDLCNKEHTLFSADNDSALSRSRQMGCGASCLLTTCTLTLVQATPALPTLISSQM